MRDAMLHQQVAHRIDAAVHRRADDDRDGKAAMLAEFAPRRQYADEDIRKMAVARDQPLEIGRSEEHTSELQSLMRISYAGFCLKKKQATTPRHQTEPGRRTQR